ncbi:hypothetical protein [Adhaeribacter aquaticus]|uniref:hypothetical protein n=1 Tax=Adhaeribacter aquaticus TaxID=299567 RepID=UPI00041F399F|nr:hypothetical protein [Adhaeribacter aquaticus]
MNVINKYWEADEAAPHQQNLYGSIDLEDERSEKELIASYYPLMEAWNWEIYIYNNKPDMREYGTCRTEEEARNTISHYINLI